jgi:hypothetical protein
MGRCDWFAHCDSRDADHRTAVHDGHDSIKQVRGHSLGGPSCGAAPTSNRGGAAGGSAHITYASEAYLHARKIKGAGLDSKDGRWG